MTGKVVTLGDPGRHFWLTRSVARSLQVNLSDAMECDLLSTVGYEALVTRCRQCQHVTACEDWLAKQAGTARHAPPFCRNRDTLDDLAARLRPLRRA